MTEISWLHISDLHFDGGMEHDHYDVDKVLAPLIATVADQTAASGPPDLTFVTGDIGNTGTSEDYEIAQRFFERLLEASESTRDTLWLVPGNHDVDRNVGRALLRTLTDEQSASEWFFAKPENRSSHLEKFAAYRNFLEEYFPDRELAEGDVVHEPAVLELHGHKLGVLPLNSAWFSQDDSDIGKLWVGARLVRERSEFLRKNGADTIVALLHHPFSFLHENDTSKAWLREGCDLLLRGHLHTAEVENVISATGAALEVAAGATYQGSDWPCRAFWSALNLRTGEVTLRPFRYVDNPAAKTWPVDVEAFPDRGASGYSQSYRLRSWRQPTNTLPEPSGFPHSDWTAANKLNWLPGIVEWFSSVYETNPVRTMRELLEHVFDILQHVPDQPNIDVAITNLATALRPYLPPGRAATCAHHSILLDLLAFGINRNLSHLFMLPRIARDALLEVPNYSRLLLATRQLAAGDYGVASALASEIGSGCCVALYVLGQCDRKVELNHEADNKFARLSRLIERMERRGPRAYSCTASVNLECLCNSDLLKASVNRARGVVARRLGNDEAAITFFDAAVDAARAALATMGSVAPFGESNEVVSRYDETPHRALADVYYSYGYYWYEKGNLGRARDLFDESIAAMSQSNVDADWDSPYTRLAILHVVEGRVDEALEAALTARDICKNTAPSRNREAALSLSIVTLTLRVLEGKLDRVLIDQRASVDNEIDAALATSPPLGLGPIACHRKDAELLRNASCDATVLVDAVISKLREAERILRSRKYES